MTSTDASSLAAVFKAYDVRGTVPDQIDEELARAVGAAFVTVTGSAGGTVVVGHDMRPSSPGLSRAFADGAATAGADVTLIGLASTDELYFASGSLGVPGAMFTASHNPAQYNGIKMCRAQAVPLGADTGLTAVRDLVAAGEPAVAERPGTVVERDVLEEYAAHLLSLAPVTGRRLRGGRRRRQRDGRAHRARRCSAGWTSRSCRCTTSSTAPSRTTRRTRSSPPTWPTCRRRCARPAPTSGSPSTATPTAASSSTSAARSSARRWSPR